MKRRKFTSEQKAQIILSVLRNEASILEISKRYNITPSLIHKWKDVMLAKLPNIFNDTNNTELHKKIEKYEHVIAKITTQNDFLEKVLQATK